MSHCPQCGETTPEEARACPFCGSLLAAPARAPVPTSRTIVGVSAREVKAAANPGATPQPPAAPPPAAPPAGAPRASRTIVGMPATVLPDAPQGPAPVPARLRVGQTMVGMSLPDAAKPPAGPIPAPRAGAPMPRGGTLLGVARPGIAPLAPGEVDDGPADEPAPPGYEPARELGATMGPGAIPERFLGEVRDKQREQERDRRRRRIVVPAAVPKGQAKAPRRDEERASKRALALVATAGSLALVAVLVALFWPSPPPLRGLARLDDKGRDVVELTCKSCPDGTKLTVSGVSATTSAGVALVLLPTPLSVGDNRLKVSVDRPGNGRDEVIPLTVPVAHRIRPDFATLQADKPSLQILAEVASGTSVTIDGRKMAIADGHGAENVDVTDLCTGLADDVRTLNRQIPYTVNTPSDPPEQGMVSVSVQIVSLRLDSPVGNAGGLAPHVITDGPSFLLAGWTTKGAEVFAAGRSIPVRPDGHFAQIMNVSSVGSTTIEVRAKMAGMAPRIAQIKVRRVESLDKAARELPSTDPPVPFAKIAADIAGSAGKPVDLTGEVFESSPQLAESVVLQTIMLLDVSAASGCPAGSSCTVRLVQGGSNPAKRGDALRVVGHVARAFSRPGRPDIPEIEVDFTLKGDPGAGKPAIVKDRR